MQADTAPHMCIMQQGADAFRRVARHDARRRIHQFHAQAQVDQARRQLQPDHASADQNGLATADELLA
ncbi:hypothetical protein SDC9_181232 [bioreactor metagenome]|uniref:Uncharacterized protein n=1 Tax=bioreactor metagenome TaxID=1076179 RepID=A0A645H407_9ZZZZ